MSADIAPSPGALTAAEEALRALAKALRAMQMYLPNNPTRAQAVTAAGASFAKLWIHEAMLELVVRESSFEWHGHAVYQDLERASEGLPWLLYRDGIRMLQLEAGFETGSLEKLLALFQLARSATSEDDDLVTLLWVADLEHVRYRHVEVDQAGDMALFDDAPRDVGYGRGSGHDDASGRDAAPPAVLMMESERHRAPRSSESSTAPSAAVIDPEGFESTLYFLDSREVGYLNAELEREYAVDHWRRTFGMLFDIVEMPDSGHEKLRALEHVDELLVECLALRAYDSVAYALREASTALQRGTFAPEVVNALTALPGRLSDPAVMGQLLQTLDEARHGSDIALVEEFISELHPMALEPMARWLSLFTDSPARATIERAAIALASAHTGALTQLLEHTDSATVRGAIWIAARLGTPAAVPGLARVLRGEDSALRAEAIGALAGIGSPAAQQALERGVDDSSRDVRMATYRAIMNRRSIGALPRLAQTVRKKEMRGADLAERMLLFEAYGTLCGDAGVAELDGLLNARGFLGAKETPETRACAARALGLIGTPIAVAALQRASNTKDAVVRSAVSRALRGGE